MLPIKTGFIILLCYLGLLFFLAITPDRGMGQGDWITMIHPNVANLLHIPAYGLLAWLLLLSIRSYDLARIHAVILVMMLAGMYGAFMELCQTFIPGRHPSVMDCLLNAVGIFMVGGLYLTDGPSRFGSLVKSKSGQ